MNLKSKEEQEVKFYKDPYFYTLIALLVIVIGLIIYVLNFVVLSDTKRVVRNAQTVNKIASLKGSSELSGRFYLGYGSFGSTDYYVFMQKDDKFGGYTKEKVPASETLIIEKNIEPNIAMNYCIVEKEEKRPFFSKYHKSSDSLEYSSFSIPIPDNVKYKYLITVPVGTVTEKLTFDPTN